MATNWKVHTKGSPKKHEDGVIFEICVMKDDFEHGKRSYGWIHIDQKFKIADENDLDGDLHSYKTRKQMFEHWLWKAKLIADTFNNNDVD